MKRVLRVLIFLVMASIIGYGIKQKYFQVERVKEIQIEEKSDKAKESEILEDIATNKINLALEWSKNNSDDENARKFIELWEQLMEKQSKLQQAQAIMEQNRIKLNEERNDENIKELKLSQEVWKIASKEYCNLREDLYTMTLKMPI